MASLQSPCPLFSYPVTDHYELMKVGKALRYWWPDRARVLASTQANADDKDTLANYSRFAKEMAQIILLMADPNKKSTWKLYSVIVTKDVEGRVQAVGICALKETPFTPEAPYKDHKKHTCLTHLITAPGNLKLDTVSCDDQVRGSGTAVLQKCSQLGYPMNRGALYVESTEPAETFYQKLGFFADEECRNYFNETVPMYLTALQALRTFGRSIQMTSIAPVVNCEMVETAKELKKLRNTLYSWSCKTSQMAKKARGKWREEISDYREYSSHIKVILSRMLEKKCNWHLYSVVVARDQGEKLQALAICALRETPFNAVYPFKNSGATCVTHLITAPNGLNGSLQKAAIAVLNYCSWLSGNVKGALYVESKEADEPFYEKLGFVKDEDFMNAVMGTVPMFLPANKAKLLRESELSA